MPKEIYNIWSRDEGTGKSLASVCLAVAIKIKNLNFRVLVIDGCEEKGGGGTSAFAARAARARWNIPFDIAGINDEPIEGFSPSDYDFVIIDHPAGDSPPAANAGLFLIPAILSARGLRAAMEAKDEIEKQSGEAVFFASRFGGVISNDLPHDDKFMAFLKSIVDCNANEFFGCISESAKLAAQFKDGFLDFRGHMDFLGLAERVSGLSRAAAERRELALVVEKERQKTTAAAEQVAKEKSNISRRVVIEHEDVDISESFDDEREALEYLKDFYGESAAQPTRFKLCTRKFYWANGDYKLSDNQSIEEDERFKNGPKNSEIQQKGENAAPKKQGVKRL